MLCQLRFLIWIDLGVAGESDSALRPVLRGRFAPRTGTSGRDHVRHLNVVSQRVYVVFESVLVHVDHDSSTISGRRPKTIKAIEGRKLWAFEQVVIHLSSLYKLPCFFLVMNLQGKTLRSAISFSPAKGLTSPSIVADAPTYMLFSDMFHDPISYIDALLSV
jgi:hypothetical protein